MPYSLADVLRLRKPFVMENEMRSSRTTLALQVRARFRPSGIMESTVTPDTGHTPGNMLHSISATELKIEEVIKHNVAK